LLEDRRAMTRCRGVAAGRERLDLISVESVEQPIAFRERCATPTGGDRGSEMAAGDFDVAADRVDRGRIDLRHVPLVSSLEAPAIDLLAPRELLLGGAAIRRPYHGAEDRAGAEATWPVTLLGLPVDACTRMDESAFVLAKGVLDGGELDEVPIAVETACRAYRLTFLDISMNDRHHTWARTSRDLHPR
jgi:hypothetical protein